MQEDSLVDRTWELDSTLLLARRNMAHQGYHPNNAESYIPGPNDYLEGDGGISAGLSRPDTAGDEEMGPERLFAILEETVPRPDEALNLTQEQMQMRKEMVEQTWERVRKWFWTHASQEERAAAAHIRGNADATPLHLMCKLNNPPTDVVQNIVEAAPEVVSYVDSHGWLPLHHACANGASPEVLSILTTAYPESKMCQDNQNRTPLHFYATRNSDNPAAMAANVVLLSDTGAAELADRGGMLPMHYACAYGTSPSVLKVLAEAYPESLVTKENKGRTPIHLAMVNAHREQSPGVIRFLLDGEGKKTVNMRDDEQNLPLHLLSLGLKGLSYEEPEKLNNVVECLKMYLAAEPFASPDFLTALQDLPDWLQDVAVVSPHVRNILNEKIIQRFPTSILMLDGYILVLIIVAFERTTTTFIDLAHKNDLDSYKEGEQPPEWVSGSLYVLFAGGTYFFLREFVQIISLLSLGSFTSWFFDTTNWVDMAVITLVYWYGVYMAREIEDGELVDYDYKDLERSYFRPGVAFTKGVLWMAVIYFLKSTLVDFAVFVGGVYYVVQRLVAFLLAVGVILLAFAQMFFIVYKETKVCSFNPSDPVEFEEEFGFPKCDFPHCTFEHSLLKVYTMMMGEIGTETRYNSAPWESSTVAQILYVLYAFLVVILLSNVLIAIVTDSYEIIQNDRAAIVFWSNRLDFVAEMDAIASVVRKLVAPLVGGDKKNSRAPGAPMSVQESPNGTIVTSSDELNAAGSKGYMREGWKQMMALFESNVYDEVDLNPSNLEFWVYLCYQGFAGCIVMPLWIALGLVTAGWLWPPQVREYLFVQKETAVSRAELERQKLEQLREIQIDIKTLKTEIRKEMAADRDEMIRLKGEVEAVQSEVLSDLEQVKDLMTTLLDLGGISQDR